MAANQPSPPSPTGLRILDPVVMGRRRVFCCHRATLSGLHPPNSLAAVAECISARVPRLEIDIRFLADDALLVFHDDALDHETTGTGDPDVLDRAGAKLLRYRPGESHGLAFLEEVAGLIRGGDTLLQVDLKLVRPISAARVAALSEALHPIRDQTLLGSDAHWNLRPFIGAGIPLAFDPTYQLNCWPDPPTGPYGPARRGLHGFWDDALLAHVPGVPAEVYLQSRLDDVAGMVPGVRELMVDIPTLLAMSALGVRAGDSLAQRGIELGAWTLADAGAERTSSTLRSLFALGATTIITDHPAAHAACAESL